VTINRVDNCSVSSYRVPLLDEWGDQTHKVDGLELVLVDIVSSDGNRGTGFSYTVGVGGKAIEALLTNYIVPRLEGVDAVPRQLWHHLWLDMHDNGGGGITTMAIAAVDIALWDLWARSLERSLVDLIGRFREKVPAYGSGINLNRSTEALQAQAAKWLEDGYKAIKVKVGKPDPEEDLARLMAVREVVGQTPLMIDANQGWDRTKAHLALKVLEAADPYWVEEPLLADDVDGHVDLRHRTRTPLAVGENLYTRYQFNQYLSGGGCDFLQPDVVRVGGITPFMEIANLAHVWNIPVAPHFLRELTGQLLCCIPNGLWLEDVHGGSFSELGILTEPLPVERGYFRPPPGPGHGLSFDIDTLKRWAI